MVAVKMAHFPGLFLESAPFFSSFMAGLIRLRLCRRRIA
jgi:hypothetical protein